MMRGMLWMAGLLFSGQALAATATVQPVDGRMVESIVVRHPTARAVVVFENGSRATVDILTHVGERLFFSSTVRREIAAIAETSEQVLAQGDIDDKPMIRLVNQPKGATAVPVDFGVVNSDAQTMAFVRQHVTDGVIYCI